jgi:hypothetical protein
MRSGVKVKDIVTGAGNEAERGKTVVANVRLFLNYGIELTTDLGGGPRMVIELDQRDCIAGLRYGIEGMRAGGTRELIISPHLAYGVNGVHGLVPPNSIIRAQVELVEVRDSDARRPHDFAPGKHLFVTHPGEALRRQPRWQFSLDDEGHFEIEIIHPSPGVLWLHTRNERKTGRLDSEKTRHLFENAFALPQSFPKDCHLQEALWSDTSERGNAIPRLKSTNELCLTIGVMERGQWLCDFNLSSTSQAQFDMPLMRVIRRLVEGGEHESVNETWSPMSNADLFPAMDRA